MKLLVSRCETLRFTTGNTLFLGEKRSVSNRVETNYKIALLIMLNCGIVLNSFISAQVYFISSYKSHLLQ